MHTDTRPATPPEDVEARILDFIRAELLVHGLAVGRDDDLLADDMLDSIAVLRLAAFVDEEFRIGMQPADFVIENFRTVSALVEYVRRATGGTAAPHHPEAGC